MAKRLKAVEGIDNRWLDCLQRHYPHHDTEVGEMLLTLLAYISQGAPPINTVADSSRPSTRMASTAKPLCDVQKAFGRHYGDITNLLVVYKTWDRRPKRERPLWCKQHFVNNASMSLIQEALLDLKEDVKLTERRRSLRSATPSKTSDEGSLMERLSAILLRVFPDCVYFRWHKGQHYLNCVTVETHKISPSDLDLFQQFGVQPPEFIFCLPNIRSENGQEDSNSSSEVSVSLELPNSVAYADNSPVVQNLPRIVRKSALKVVLPFMGDTALLNLVGTPKAQEDLEANIRKACSDKDMLLSVEVREPDATCTNWKLEIYCPLMHEEKVLIHMCDTVSQIRDDLESEAETRTFPGSTDAKLLVYGGAQTQIIPRGQHLVLVHLLVEREHKSDLEECQETGFLNFVVTSSLKKCGEICIIERNSEFPDETLWGAVWFKSRVSALEAVEMARNFQVFPGTKMKVVLADSDAPLYRLNFHWWKEQVVENKMEVYVLSEKHLNLFKAKEAAFETLHFEYDTEALKVTITSDDPEPILLNNMFGKRERRPHPKYVNYSHDVRVVATSEDIKHLGGAVKERVARYFTGPEMLNVKVCAPQPDASQTKGTITSHSATSLFHTIQYMSSHKGYRVGNGKMTLSPGVYIDFSAPKKVFEKVNPRLTAFLKERKTEEEDEYESDSEDESDVDEEADLDKFMVKVNDPAELMKEIAGDEMTMTTVLYEHYDMAQLKEFSRLLKPHVVHVRGEVLTTLLSTTGKDNQPRYVHLMTETDTFIKVVKQKCLLHVYGEGEKVSMVKEKLKTIQTDLIEKAHVATEHKKPEKEDKEDRHWRETISFENDSCPGCNRDVKGVGFRLSLCGHRYCHTCFRDLVSPLVNYEGYVPLKCGIDYCECLVLFVDIEAICWYYNLSLTDLYVSAILSLDTGTPCITDGCLMMYHDPNHYKEGLAQCFTCPLCKVSMCMACFGPYHFGVNCTVHKALKTLDPRKKEWLDADRSSRKLCPKCLNGIEKVEGSPRVFCRRCNVFICWNCLEYGTHSQNHCHKCVREDA